MCENLDDRWSLTTEERVFFLECTDPSWTESEANCQKEGWLRTDAGLRSCRKCNQRSSQRVPQPRAPNYHRSRHLIVFFPKPLLWWFSVITLQGFSCVCVCVCFQGVSTILNDLKVFCVKVLAHCLSGFTKAPLEVQCYRLSELIKSEIEEFWLSVCGQWMETRSCCSFKDLSIRPAELDAHLQTYWAQAQTHSSSICVSQGNLKYYTAYTKTNASWNTVLPSVCDRYGLRPTTLGHKYVLEMP